MSVPDHRKTLEELEQRLKENGGTSFPYSYNMIEKIDPKLFRKILSHLRKHNFDRLDLVIQCASVLLSKPRLINLGNEG